MVKYLLKTCLKMFTLSSTLILFLFQINTIYRIIEHSEISYENRNRISKYTSISSHIFILIES